MVRGLGIAGGQAHVAHCHNAHISQSVVSQPREVVQKSEKKTSHTSAKLVNLIYEHHRVAGASGFEALHHFARHRPHIRPSVTLDLSHITQPSHTEPVTSKQVDTIWTDSSYTKGPLCQTHSICAVVHQQSFIL